MLVMKPCDADVTTNEDECIDEEELNKCIEMSEEAVQQKMAQLNVDDPKEEMLRDGSF